MDNCWEFVGGTVRPTCRPTENQRAFYNGRKIVHALMFQSVVKQNGLIANLFGLFEGRRHDSAMLVLTDLLTKLDQSPFAQRAGFTPEKQAFNQSMSQARVAVE